MRAGALAAVIVSYWLAIAGVMGIYLWRIGADLWFFIIFIILVVIGAGLTIVVMGMAGAFSSMDFMSDTFSGLTSRRYEEKIDKMLRDIEEMKKMIEEIRREFEE